jgi:RNA polymerase sigma-70 factor (ECF subfamily)
MQERFAHHNAWEADIIYATDVWRLGYTPTPSTFSLTQIIDAARLGDSTAFTLLVQQYKAAADRIAQQILRTEDAAADAVQEALIKAHRAMHRFEDGNFRSWLLRIVTNTCYDHLRRQKRRGALSLDELMDEAHSDSPYVFEEAAEQHRDDPERIAVENETMQLMLAAIDRLPVWHRTVVLLVDVHGYDYNEAAEILCIPLGTVKSRLSRARSALRDELMKSGVVTPEMLVRTGQHPMGKM